MARRELKVIHHSHILGDELFAPRQYTNTELKDFHGKIQRFMIEKKLDDGETFKVLDYWELGVAYGAYVKREGTNKKIHYMACADASGKTERAEQLENLMRQYDEWRKKQDWIATNEIRTLEVIHSSDLTAFDAEL